MYYLTDENKTIKSESYENGYTSVVGVFDYEKYTDVCNFFDMDIAMLQEGIKSKYAKYESLEGYDFCCANMIDYNNLHTAQRRVIILMKKDCVMFISDESARILSILDNAIAARGEKVSVNKIVYDFFRSISVGDIESFDNIEKEILDLEKALITSKKRECVKEILSLRKRLMVLKKYYEQFMEVLDGIKENDNKIFDKKILSYFKVMEKRNDRLFQNVLNLRDYVTQVRESYQAEVDISLNTTMKVFTVITAIFLPLSLIVGWYGMNFKMPEYEWAHGYAIVIAISIVVIVVGIGYFKKKKWF